MDINRQVCQKYEKQCQGCQNMTRYIQKTPKGDKLWHFRWRECSFGTEALRQGTDTCALYFPVETRGIKQVYLETKDCLAMVADVRMLLHMRDESLYQARENQEQFYLDVTNQIEDRICELVKGEN